jgi:hypothetical protein
VEHQRCRYRDNDSKADNNNSSDDVDDSDCLNQQQKHVQGNASWTRRCRSSVHTTSGESEPQPPIAGRCRGR